MTCTYGRCGIGIVGSGSGGSCGGRLGAGAGATTRTKGCSRPGVGVRRGSRSGGVGERPCRPPPVALPRHPSRILPCTCKCQIWPCQRVGTAGNCHAMASQEAPAPSMSQAETQRDGPQVCASYLAAWLRSAWYTGQHQWRHWVAIIMLPYCSIQCCQQLFMRQAQRRRRLHGQQRVSS